MLVQRLFVTPLLVIVCLVSGASAQNLPPPVRVFRDLRYGRYEPANLLDLYVPAATGAPVPLVIWVHGGGWESGVKEAWPAIFLVDKGYAVASINYRLSSEAPFPAQIHDCKAAVRSLRADARKYHLDPKHFGVWGASAGGHLAALLGTSSDVKELEGLAGKRSKTNSDVQAVCDWFGPTDLEQLASFRVTFPKFPADYTNQMVTRLLGGPVQQKKLLAGHANPIRFVSAKAPPFLIMHGGSDTMVPLEQSQILERALTAAGAQVEFLTVPGADHGLFSDLATLQTVEKFFNKTLRDTTDRQHQKGDEDVKLLATYRHQANDQAPALVQFYSNGRLLSPDGINTWLLRRNKLYLCWYNSKAKPFGVWVDTCDLINDGKAYRGANQQGDRIVGERRGEGNLNPAAVHAKASR